MQIPVILAADDAKAQDKWIIHLREATNMWNLIINLFLIACFWGDFFKNFTKLQTGWSND